MPITSSIWKITISLALVALKILILLINHFVAREMSQTDRHTHKPSIVTLIVHACQESIIVNYVTKWSWIHPRHFTYLFLKNFMLPWSAELVNSALETSNCSLVYMNPAIKHPCSTEFCGAYCCTCLVHLKANVSFIMSIIYVSITLTWGSLCGKMWEGGMHIHQQWRNTSVTLNLLPC